MEMIEPNWNCKTIREAVTEGGDLWLLYLYIDNPLGWSHRTNNYFSGREGEALRDFYRMKRCELYGRYYQCLEDYITE